MCVHCCNKDGCLAAATDRRLVQHLGFTHIVDASNGHNALRLPSIRYLEVPLTDIDASQLLPHLEPVVSFIDAARTENPNAQVASVAVCCCCCCTDAAAAGVGALLPWLQQVCLISSCLYALA